MFHCSFRGGGRNGTSTNHFSAVITGCSVNILRILLHYRLIKLLIKLALIALLIELPKTVQNGFQRIKIFRVVPLLSTCDKRLDNTFSKFLISCTCNCLFWDKVLQVFSNQNEDVKMTYVHKKNELMEDIKIIQNEVPENTNGSIQVTSQNIKDVSTCDVQNEFMEDIRYIKIVQNELPENTSGSMPVISQNIKDVSSCDDEQCLQLHCHSNEHNDTMGFVCFTTTKSDFQTQVSGNDNQQNNNHNRLLSLNNVGFKIVFSKFRSSEMDIMFADDMGFKIGFSKF